jgi:hypothetical protein
MTSFWTGFFAGIAATYALSACVGLAFLLEGRRSARRLQRQAECLRTFVGYDPASGESWSPEYPSVSFTHLTSIGSAVRGYDD